MKDYKNWLQNIKGYSNKTIEIYSKYAFELEVNNLDWKKTINHYSERKNSTKRLVLSALKSYLTFKESKSANEITLPKKIYVVADFVTYEEYRDYLKKINIKTKMGFQKRIIIRLLFETGIRASELLSIYKKDISQNRILIHGKGNKQRYVLLSPWLESELEMYLATLKDEKLFNFEYKNLYSKINRIDQNRNLTPHMFRYGFARYCYKKGVSIYDISLSMGHSSIDTTAKYIQKKSEDTKIYTIF